MDKFNGKPSFLKEASFFIVRGLAGTGISFKSVAFPNRYIRHRNGKLFVDVGSNNALFKKDATFNVRYGLGASKGHFGISFQSVNYPNTFISLVGSRLQIVKMTNSAAFKMAATWVPVTAKIDYTKKNYS